MDPGRFDSLTRSLATSKSRRGFLAGVAALAAGALGGLRGGAQTGCPPGQTLNSKGDCGCPAGTDACLDGCYRLTSDLANCGACGTICPLGAECRKGECRCPRGSIACGGACRTQDSFAGDPANCGGCGIVCPPGDPTRCEGAGICSGGACGVAPAIAGTICRLVAGACDVAETCDGSSLACPPDAFASAATVCRPPAGPCDPPESCTGASLLCPDDFRTPDGQQGNCPTGEQCAGGACQAICLPLGEICSGRPDGCCAPLVCDRDDRCLQPPGGSCTASSQCVDDADACCSNICVSLLLDENHCGSCAGVCPPTFICDGGECRPPCRALQATCNGTNEICCFPLICEPFSNTCRQPIGGACTSSDDCADFFAGCCSGICTNLILDEANCGACGNRCPLNEFCDGGAGRCVCSDTGESAAPLTCCPDGQRICVGTGGGGDFLQADTCAIVSTCPAGYTACVGTGFDDCRACCPPGSICAAEGYCQQ